jgi:hypothetical protein
VPLFFGRYSRHQADLAEKAANKADGLAIETDDLDADKSKLLSPFAKHAPNHLHILYCSS